MDAKMLIKDRYTFTDLCAIMALLRSENGCPWDKAQTNQSIRTNLIEECYEAIEGIDSGNDALLKEELGDILLQVVFHAQIAKDGDRFDIEEVINGICKKLVSRHPHIFADDPVVGQDKALDKWEEMKKKEKKTGTVGEDLDRVAKSLPSLLRTQKLIKKAQKGGLYSCCEGASDRDELMAQYFALCAAANSAGINLEEEAYKENEEFIARITALEKLIGETNDED